MPRNDWAITGGLCVAALLAVVLVFVTAPGRPQAAVYDVEGQPLFPDLTDPHQPASIEITGWNEALGAATPFKVQRKNGRWVLPSHEDYPAEAEDRLVRITGNVIALKWGALQSESEQDHAALGVVDPMDDKNPSLKGRGLRCVLRDESERVLADFVVGKDVAGRDNFKYVRLVGQRSTYAVNLKDVELSSDFYDWIEKDLLKLEAFKVRRIELDHYKVDEKKGQIVTGDVVTITKPQSTNQWVVEEIQPGEKVNDDRIDEITQALDEIEIVDVRRKPKGISGALKQEAGAQISPQDQMDLQTKGFFLSDRGLVSNDGEVRVWDEDGVLYILRFGELAPSTDKDVERRYVFVSAHFDAAFLPEPPEPAKKEEKKDDEKKDDGEHKDGDGEHKDGDGEKKDDEQKGGDGWDMWQDPHAGHGHAPDAKPDAGEDPAHAEWKRKHDEWKRKTEAGQKRAKELNDRFADWYYVIPGETYHKLKATRLAVVLPADKDGGDGGGDKPGDDGHKDH